ncbi:hypothetical protein N9383_05875 [Granulosicoccus sp.]|nr:hypothetical protein [Granulosicoccus sp.]
MTGIQILRAVKFLVLTAIGAILAGMTGLTFFTITDQSTVFAFMTIKTSTLEGFSVDLQINRMWPWAIGDHLLINYHPIDGPMTQAALGANEWVLVSLKYHPTC